MPPRSTEPGHAFLNLAERLRQRGQLDAALSVALAGVSRFPTLAAAHDLVGRIRADQGDDEGARSAWLATVECVPGHLGALKGLAFLAFRQRDLAEAERRLEAAAVEAPHDTAILTALDRVRSALPAAVEATIRFEDPSAGLLLLDSQGLRLVGGVGSHDDGAIGDAVAAEASSAFREAERAARLLGLGEWRHLLIEGAGARVALVPVKGGAGLLIRRPVTAPAGRMLAFANRAVQAAAAWLEQHG
jgi:predicted regulator of Ras-like GTPase activity (Roadblock/LC7/MglB family)